MRIIKPNLMILRRRKGRENRGGNGNKTNEKRENKRGNKNTGRTKAHDVRKARKGENIERKVEIRKPRIISRRYRISEERKKLE